MPTDGLKQRVNIEEDEKTDRSIRLLKMYDVLMRGSGLDGRRLQSEFSVTAKSVQRDIAMLREHISREYPQSEYGNIEYSRVRKEYYWRNRSNMLLDEKEILLLATILLESRGLTREELQQVVDKMLVQCSPESEKRIRTLLKNELFHYKPVKNARLMGSLLWQLAEAKTKQHCLQVTYKAVRSKKYHPLKLLPLGIMFSEMYFYLLAKVAGQEQETPVAFRVDRIGECETLEETFSVPYEARFQEGIFRSETQLMTTGELLKVKLRFWGKSLEAVLDKLPNAKIISQDDKGTVLKVQVYAKGAKMWFLSQAEYLEVLEPQSLREEMRETIARMLGNYAEG